MTALLLMPLLGMVGVAVDLGFGHLHHRELQNAADAGALAGASALGEEIVFRQNATLDGELRLYFPKPPYSDTGAIYRDVETAAAASIPPFEPPARRPRWPTGPGNELVAEFVRADGSKTAIGWGGRPEDAIGVRVEARRRFPTFFARILGACCEQVSVTAAARADFKPIRNADPQFAAPFIVCGYAPSPGMSPPPRGSSPTVGAFVARPGAAAEAAGVVPTDDTSMLRLVQDLRVWVGDSSQVNYSKYAGTKFLVHWQWLAEGYNGRGNARTATCGAKTGLADVGYTTQAGDSCRVVKYSVSQGGEPCFLRLSQGNSLKGTVRQSIVGMPGCTLENGDLDSRRCVMLLPITSTCSTGGRSPGGEKAPFCLISNVAPFYIVEGRHDRDQPADCGDCFLGVLLRAAMTEGAVDWALRFDPTSPGVFTYRLVPDS